ncbi:C40 family peptidase [Arthrobacter sp. NPDC055138]
MTDTMGRIQQIQSTLTQLTQPAVAAEAASGTSGSGSAGGSTASTFADALTAATGSSAVGGADGTAGTAGAASGTAASGSAAELIAATEKYVGLPYVWGGNDASVGLDCSSFVQHAFRDVGIDLPRVTWDQMKEGTPVASMADAKPGDLLFSFDGGHVSIYLGNGKAIDAPQPGDTIKVRDAWENDSNITTIRRILPDEPTVQAAGGVGAAASALAGSSPLTADQQSALTELIGAAQLSTSTGLGSMLSGQNGTAGAISAMLSGQTGNTGFGSMLAGQGATGSSAGSGQMTDLLATAQAAMATGQRA